MVFLVKKTCFVIINSFNVYKNILVHIKGALQVCTFKGTCKVLIPCQKKNQLGMLFYEYKGLLKMIFTKIAIMATLYED